MAAALANEPAQFYPEATPPVGGLVIAEITSISDAAVYCSLPAYRSVEAMIPTSEIYVKRHRRVTDYVKIGQRVVAQVLRESPLDLSLKIVREEERAETLAAFGRDSKIHQIARVAADGDADYLAALLQEQIWPRGDGEAIMNWMMAVRGGDAEAAVGAPVCLIDTIRARLPEPIVTQNRDVMIRFGTAPDGVSRLNALLTELAAIPDLTVVVTAPPTYRLIATASNRAAAVAILEAAAARIPAAL
jgi:translation initiation factor 2 alpha subunit (eIF-2alpha)